MGYLSESGLSYFWGKLKTIINAKYTKPSGGIPKADLSSEVQTSLGKADTALQHDSLTLYNKLYTATTDGTGNIVLGAAFDGRMIVNVQVVNTLICWALGSASGSGANKMLHFWTYSGQNLVSTSVTFRLYWFEPSEYNIITES